METMFSQFSAILAAVVLIPGCIFVAYGISHASMAFWRNAAITYFLIFIGSTLAVTRNYIPEPIGVFLSNATIGYGYFHCIRAVRIVKSYDSFRGVDAAVTGLFFIGLILVISFENTYLNRVILISSLIALFSTLVFFATIRSSYRISAVGDAVLMVFSLGNALFATFRIGTALLNSDSLLLRFQFWDQAFFIWSIVAGFCFAIGLLLNGIALISQENHLALHKERMLTRALSEAIEGQRDLTKLILHEINRPLTHLHNAVRKSHANQEGMSPEQVEHVFQLTYTANDYLREISDFEDISALLDNPTPLNVTVSSVAKDLGRKWRVQVDVSEDVLRLSISVDLLLFDVAIGNLIDNAFKFATRREGVSIRIGRSADRIFFDVLDDGHGISALEADKVFHKFYKIRVSGTDSIKGCGLGLYVARRASETLNGNCEVLSQSPSIMRITFPIHFMSGESND
jgi:signal transduction histidine kinase